MTSPALTSSSTPFFDPPNLHSIYACMADGTIVVPRYDCCAWVRHGRHALANHSRHKHGNICQALHNQDAWRKQADPACYHQRGLGRSCNPMSLSCT